MECKPNWQAVPNGSLFDKNANNNAYKTQSSSTIAIVGNTNTACCFFIGGVYGEKVVERSISPMQDTNTFREMHAAF